MHNSAGLDAKSFFALSNLIMGSTKLQLKKSANILIKAVGFSDCTYMSVYIDVYMC